MGFSNADNTQDAAPVADDTSATVDAEPSSSEIMTQDFLCDFPDGVVVRVLEQLSLCDISNARVVSRMWRLVIDNNAVEVWKARCNTLGILPAEGTDTALGRAASRFRSKIAAVRTQLAGAGNSKAVKENLSSLYRTYRSVWVKHVCRSYSDDDLCAGGACCKLVTDYGWYEARLGADGRYYMQGTDFVAGVNGIKAGDVRLIVEACLEPVLAYSSGRFALIRDEFPFLKHFCALLTYPTSL